MINHLYVLDDQGEPRVEHDIAVWGRFMTTDERRFVRQQRWQDPERDVEVFVSTVFLGSDHSFGHGQPVLWETMVFIDGEDVFQTRYTSRDAAIRGHRRAVQEHGGQILE